MIRHITRHQLGKYINNMDQILFIDNFEYKQYRPEELITEIALVTNPQKTKIKSVYPLPQQVPQPIRENISLVTTEDITSPASLIVLNTGQMDQIVLNTILKYNKTTTLIVNDQIAKQFYGNQSYDVFPFLLNFNVIIQKQREYPSIILPQIGNMNHTFNGSMIPMNESNKPQRNLAGAKWELIAIRCAATQFTQSSIMFCQKNGNEIQIINTNSFHASNTESYEDPRLFTINGELYMAYVKITDYKVGIHTSLKLTVARLEVTDSMEVRLVGEWTPRYGANLETGPEKNWMFWESPEGKITCAYYPHKLLEFDDFDTPPREISLTTPPDSSIRGGSPGVIYNGRVFCFTHTANSFNVGVLIYSHESVPRLLGYANNIYETDKHMGSFFYVCGAMFNESQQLFVLSGGVNDIRMKIMLISLKDVESKVKWV